MRIGDCTLHRVYLELRLPIGDSQVRFADHWLAGDFGIPISLGNTIMETGVHLAASSPECLYLEYSDLAWNRLVKQPARFEDGYAFAPTRPGLGVDLDYDALAIYSRPD